MLRILAVPLRRCVTAISFENGKIAIPKTEEGMFFFAKAILAEKAVAVAEKDKAVAVAVAEKDKVLAEKDKAIAEKELINFKYDFAVVTER